MSVTIRLYDIKLASKLFYNNSSPEESNLADPVCKKGIDMESMQNTKTQISTKVLPQSYSCVVYDIHLTNK